MQIDLEITGLSVLLVLLSFLATVDMAYGHLSDVGLRRLLKEAESRPSSLRFLQEILDNRPRFRFTLSAVMQILLVGATVLTTSICRRFFLEQNFILIALFIALALAIIFRQLIPRLISLRNPERTLLALLPIFRPIYRVISIVAMPWHKSFDRFRIDRNADEDDEEPDTDATDVSDLQALIDVGEEEGIIEEEEGELIHSIIEFGDTRVASVMTPRTDIVSLPVTATVRQARDVMIDSKYSRIPAYREQIDQIEGLIYVRDLLGCWLDGTEDVSIETLLRPAYFIPETKPVAQLLEEMKKARVQLALVIDEYGGVSGLVTVEDILEEIVGEIEDEDVESDEVVELVAADGGYYEMAGSTEIGKIERLFDIEIETDDFTTIAGLIINEADSVPRTGEKLMLRGLDIEILDADERRINRLRLRQMTDGEHVTDVESATTVQQQ